MILKTKFDLGQLVYIVQPVCQEIIDVCPACQGNGYVELNGEKYPCPNSQCIDGQIHKGYEKDHYKITFHSKIGKVTVEKTESSYKVYYMLVATGVGSGALWVDDEEQGSRIFTTKKEAEEYCKMKNKKEPH